MIDWTPVRELLDEPGLCLITTHINLDGDALGCELALALWLEARGRPARIVNSEPVPPRYAFLDPRGACEVYDPARHDGPIAAASLTVILDVSRWNRLGAVGDALAASKAPRICIDHHPEEGPIPADVAIVDPTAAATGELLFEMMTGGRLAPVADTARASRVGDAPRAAPAGAGAPAPPADRLADDMARALYVAVMTDTGSFRHSNTTTRTHRIAAELLRHPIDTAGIFEEAYGSSSEPRLRLLGEALAAMEIQAGGAIALLVVTGEMMARLGAGPADTEGFAEFARGMRNCEAAAVLTEVAPDQVKVSLRSRHRVNVNRVASALGGGGHARAAGIAWEGTLADARAAVVAALLKALDAPPGA